VKGAALRALVQVEVFQEIVDDLAVVKADFCKGAAADLDDFVDMALAPGVGVVHAGVVRIAGLGPGYGLDAAERSLMAVHTARFDGPASEASLMIVEYGGKRPKIHPSAFVAPTAVLIGDVEVGEKSSIWFGAVLRGDNGPIRIGARTSIQDNCVVHVTVRTIVGDDVTVGHCAVMEDCDIKNHALIGSNATLLNGCIIGEGSLVAAGSVVGERVEIPARVLAAGAPAKVKKELDGSAASWVAIAADEYVHLSRSYLAQSIGAVEDQEVRL